MTTTALALLLLCGPRGPQYAEHVEAAARRFLLHPTRLAAVIAAESTCRADAVNRRTGTRGLGQILPGHSADAPGANLLDPATNLHLTARHLARLETLCGSFGGAVRVYHGHRKCQGWKHDQHVGRVLAMVDKVHREMRTQKGAENMKLRIARKVLIFSERGWGDMSNRQIRRELRVRYRRSTVAMAFARIRKASKKTAKAPARRR